MVILSRMHDLLQLHKKTSKIHMMHHIQPSIKSENYCSKSIDTSDLTCNKKVLCPPKSVKKSYSERLRDCASTFCPFLFVDSRIVTTEHSEYCVSICWRLLELPSSYAELNAVFDVYDVTLTGHINYRDLVKTVDRQVAYIHCSVSFVVTVLRREWTQRLRK